MENVPMPLFPKNAKQADLKIDKTLMKSKSTKLRDDVERNSFGRNEVLKSFGPNFIGFKIDKEIFGNKFDPIKVKNETQHRKRSDCSGDKIHTRKSKLVNTDNGNLSTTPNTPAVQLKQIRTMPQNTNQRDPQTRNISALNYSRPTNETYKNLTEQTNARITRDVLMHHSKKKSSATMHHMPLQQHNNNILLQPTWEKIFQGTTSIAKYVYGTRDQSQGRKNPHHTNYYQTKVQGENNSNRVDSHRKKIFHINQINPPMQIPTTINNQLKHPRNFVAPPTHQIDPQYTNNIYLNNATGPSPIIGNDIHFQGLQSDQRRTLDETKRTRDYNPNINEGSLATCGFAATNNYVPPSHNTDCGNYLVQGTSPIIRDRFYTNQNQYFVYQSKPMTTTLPPFAQPRNILEYYYNDDTPNPMATQHRATPSTEGKSFINAQSSKQHQVLWSCKKKSNKSEKKGMPKQSKTKSTALKCSCGKNRQVIVSVQDNDMRHCETCFNRVKQQFQEIIDGYEEQGFSPCKCKEKMSVTNVTYNYLKDQKLECTCEMDFKDVPTVVVHK